MWEWRLCLACVTTIKQWRYLINTKVVCCKFFHKFRKLREWRKNCLIILVLSVAKKTLLWCHNGLDSVSNHQPHHCLLGRLFGRRSKITSKLRVTGLCARNSLGTGEFPAQMASNAENISIWWRHHDESLQYGWLHRHLQYGMALSTPYP